MQQQESFQILRRGTGRCGVGTDRESRHLGGAPGRASHPRQAATHHYGNIFTGTARNGGGIFDALADKPAMLSHFIYRLHVALLIALSFCCMATTTPPLILHQWGQTLSSPSFLNDIGECGKDVVVGHVLNIQVQPRHHFTFLRIPIP